MSDNVKGAAVLDDRDPDTAHLWVWCVRGGYSHFTYIPVAEVGKPTAWHGKEWRYRVVGDTLHLTPSLRITSHTGAEEFHTAFEWSVRFVKYDPAFGTPSAQVREINQPRPATGGHD